MINFFNVPRLVVSVDTNSRPIGESLIELSIPEEGAGDGDRVPGGLSSCLNESKLLHFRGREIRPPSVSH